MRNDLWGNDGKNITLSKSNIKKVFSKVHSRKTDFILG
jgi:hypothetical protein